MTVRVEAGKAQLKREKTLFERHGDMLFLFAIALMAFGFLLSWRAPDGSWRQLWGKGFFVPLSNLLILIYLILSKALPSFLDYLVARRARIEESLKSFEERTDEISLRFREIRDKYANSDAEVKEILERARARAEEEKANRIAEAHKRAEELIREAKEMSEQEERLLYLKLTENLVNRSIERAEKQIKESFSPEDQERLLGEFLEKIESLKK